MKKEKTLETILTLVTVCILIFLKFKIKFLLPTAAILGLIGMFINPLVRLINKIWLKFSEILGAISSKILLSAIFFIFLTPISFFYRIFNKDVLMIRNKYSSTFNKRNHQYMKEDFGNPW